MTRLDASRSRPQEYEVSPRTSCPPTPSSDGACGLAPGHRPRRRPVFVPWQTRIDKSGGPDACWPWMGPLNSGGYGADGRRGKVHRLALQESIGRALEPGEMACHHCDNRACCNPAHLYVGDAFTNMRDRVLRGARAPRKSHCVHGHPKTPDNVRVESDGSYRCLTCARTRDRTSTPEQRIAHAAQVRERYWRLKGLTAPTPANQPAGWFPDADAPGRG